MDIARGASNAIVAYIWLTGVRLLIIIILRQRIIEKSNSTRPILQGGSHILSNGTIWLKHFIGTFTPSHKKWPYEDIWGQIKHEEWQLPKIIYCINLFSSIPTYNHFSSLWSSREITYMFYFISFNLYALLLLSAEQNNVYVPFKFTTVRAIQ